MCLASVPGGCAGQKPCAEAGTAAGRSAALPAPAAGTGWEETSRKAGENPGQDRGLPRSLTSVGFGLFFCFFAHKYFVASQSNALKYTRFTNTKVADWNKIYEFA